MSDYKPTEHGGLKKDGTPDKRVGTGGSSILSPSLATYSNDIVQSLLKARSTLMRQVSKVARPLDQDQDQVNLVTLVAAPRAVSAPESPILSHTLIQ
jgi:hypothetical protein